MLLLANAKDTNYSPNLPSPITSAHTLLFSSLCNKSPIFAYNIVFQYNVIVDNVVGENLVFHYESKCKYKLEIDFSKQPKNWCV